MWKTTEGSSGRLAQLCLGYFFFYVATGVTVKYFTGSASRGYPGMDSLEFLVYSTLGGNSICLLAALVLRWYRMESNRLVHWGGFKFPAEFFYIVPSGICTAVVIPTTTLMYMLPISVMVAMVIMRASIIIVSRIVDAIQIRQGILSKKVYREEDIAVVFALLAAGVHMVLVKKGDFDFLKSHAAVSILGSYIVAYAIRIYIMNYFKNTRAKGVRLDNKGYFAIEQFTASSAMILVTVLLFHSPQLFGWDFKQIDIFRGAISNPKPTWGWGTLAGTAYGMVAFFSVFIFMFKGRTATFAGLVNRLTSLIAGTAATLISYFLFSGRFPKLADWISLLFILIAVGFLARAERKRTAELLRLHEIGPVPAGAAGPVS
ncbi:MAG: hypothetical protein QME66_08455 [Candidatus Eisenbacteria bacterium]|nr:hypothetical protein [Candidatus Eisenbacteria bacterium]